MGSSDWPEHLPITQVRVARTTVQLDAVVTFYRDGIGLEVIGSFTGHVGYDGVIFGLPGTEYHLEFTQHVDGSPCPAPSADNLLVLYIPDRSAIVEITGRLKLMGYRAVPSENPYWDDRQAVTIEDPDGWRVVLMPTDGI